ncbi:MAG: hypothetical protein E6I51_09460 [Chloroflexi bacterium]|nr:MAG: hypothetical protein E6I51_09460 [Chloroflexota bacterium]
MSDVPPKVTMQISLAPTDLPTARHTVPHQLRVWADQVDEILFVLDLHRSPGRYGDAWQERLPGIRALIDDACRRYGHARGVEVDYSERVVEHLSATYCGGARIPPKNCFGAPIHAYLFGVEEAAHDLVFEVNGDMMYGGASRSWIDEGCRLLASRDDILTVSPLPGPPTPDGSLRSQVLQREPSLPNAYRAFKMSTRHFLLDRRTLRERIAPIALTRPDLRRRITAWLDGVPPVESLEQLISDRMREEGLLRVEFLGSAPGMWSIHPDIRSDAFYEALPRIVTMIESGTVPPAQEGCHDLGESMVDLAGTRTPRSRRAIRHLRIAARRVQNGLSALFA